MSKTVRMRAPNGEEMNVPAEHVEHYKRLKAVVVKSGGEPVSIAMDTKGKVAVTGDAQKAATDLLPAIGNMVGPAALGAVRGAPLGIPGMFLGGALGAAGGEIARQLSARAMGREDLVPETLSGEAGMVGREALLGGLFGAGENILARGVKGAGRAMMADALRPSSTISKGSIVKGGLTPLEVMERERIPVGKPPVKTPWSDPRSGFERADEAVKSSVGEAEGLLAKVPGTPFTVRDVIFEASPELAKIRGRAASAAQLDAINEAIVDAASFGSTQIKKGGVKPQKLSATDLNQRKRTWQTMADPQYAAEARTGSTQQAKAGTAGFQNEVHSALAAAANRLMERAAPGVLRQNQRSSELGMLREAILNAQARPHTINPLAHGNATSNAVFALADPSMTSRLGLSMTNPVLFNILNNIGPLGMLAAPPSNVEADY